MVASKKAMERRQVELPNNVIINCVEFGSDQGQDVVFLHGYADSWRSFERLLQVFPPEYHCHAVDLRGHGDSSKPVCCYAMKDFVNDIRLVYDALGITTSTLIGHSMGSFIAQLFAATYPERMDKLILVSSACSTKQNPVLGEIQDDIMQLEDPVAESFIAEFQAPSLPVPREFLQLIIGESKKIPARIWKEVFKELSSVDHHDIVKQIRARTLVLWGENDGIFNRDDQEALTSRIEGSSLVAYQAGHALHWEIPELVVDDIARFLGPE